MILTMTNKDNINREEEEELKGFERDKMFYNIESRKTSDCFVEQLLNGLGDEIKKDCAKSNNNCNGKKEKIPFSHKFIDKILKVCQ